MELLDVYDEAGRKTGKTAPRGSFHIDGEYALCAHIILENTDGRFLIQQRSDCKQTRPGQWDITAGAVDAGESSLDGALREAWEEVGLLLPREQVQFLFRDRCRHAFHDVWYIRIPFSLEDCTMQESEVQALRLVSAEMLIALVQQMPHRSEEYKRKLIFFLHNHKVEG